MEFAEHVFRLAEQSPQVPWSILLRLESGALSVLAWAAVDPASQATDRGVVQTANALDESSALLELASRLGVADHHTREIGIWAERLRDSLTAAEESPMHSKTNGAGQDEDEHLKERIESARKHREMMADLQRLASGEAGGRSPL